MCFQTHRRHCRNSCTDFYTSNSSSDKALRSPMSIQNNPFVRHIVEGICHTYLLPICYGKCTCTHSAMFLSRREHGCCNWPTLCKTNCSLSTRCNLLHTYCSPNRCKETGTAHTSYRSICYDTGKCSLGRCRSHSQHDCYSQ